MISLIWCGAAMLVSMNKEIAGDIFWLSKPQKLEFNSYANIFFFLFNIPAHYIKENQALFKFQMKMKMLSIAFYNLLYACFHLYLSKQTANFFLRMQACHMSSQGKGLTWHAASLVKKKREERITYFGVIKPL